MELFHLNNFVSNVSFMLYPFITRKPSILNLSAMREGPSPFPTLIADSDIVIFIIN